MLEDHAGLVQALALAGMTEAAGQETRYLDEVLRDPRAGFTRGSQDADEHYYSMDAEERKQSQAPYVDRAYTRRGTLRWRRRYLGRGEQELAAKLVESLFKRAYRRGEGMTHAKVRTASSATRSVPVHRRCARSARAWRPVVMEIALDLHAAST